MKNVDGHDVFFILLNFAEYITNILVVMQYHDYQQQQLYNILILTMFLVQIFHCCVTFFLNISEVSRYSICQVIGFLVIFFPFPPLTKCIPYIVTKMEHDNDKYINQHRLVFWMQCCFEPFATSIVQAIGIAIINDNNNFILIISFLISIINVCINAIQIGYYYNYLSKHIFTSMKILLIVCVIIDYFGILSTLLLLFDNPHIKNFNTYVCLDINFPVRYVTRFCSKKIAF